MNSEITERPGATAWTAWRSLPDTQRERGEISIEGVGTLELVATERPGMHRIDVRVSKDLNLPNGIRLTGIAEVFNVTNHANYGAYNPQINSTTFGQPRQNLLNAYQPRVGQLAFRLSF